MCTYAKTYVKTQRNRHTQKHMSVGTSEPLGVMLDGAQSGTVPKAAVDHRINGQKVCNCGCKQISLCNTSTQKHFESGKQLQTIKLEIMLKTRHQKQEVSDYST